MPYIAWVSCSYNHKVFNVRKDFKDHQDQLLNQPHCVYPYTRVPSATSLCLLNTSRHDDSTASLGSLFQCMTTFSVKTFTLILNVRTAPLEQFKAISSCPITCYWEKRPTPSCLQPPFREFERGIRSLLSLLFSRLNNPIPLSLSLHELFSRPFSLNEEKICFPELDVQNFWAFINIPNAYIQERLKRKKFSMLSHSLLG